MKRRRDFLRVSLLLLAGSLSTGNSCTTPQGASDAPTVAAPASVASWQDDADGDGVPDWADNCVEAPNRFQRNARRGVGEECVGADAQPGRADREPPEYGSCVNDGSACLRDADCIRGDACDCDFNGDGTCDIDDFNILLTTQGTFDFVVFGTDMNDDQRVDEGDFSIFEPLFAAGVPGPGRTPERVTEVVDGDREQGICYETKWSRLLYASSGRNSGSELSCSVSDNRTLDFLLTSAQRDALDEDPNNPTNALVGGNRCPNAAFSSGDKTNPLACDAHDLCGSRCGRRNAECDLQFFRDLFHTCTLLEGQEEIDCESNCRQFAVFYATAIASQGGSLNVILDPPPEDAGTGPSQRDLIDDELNCQCGPPVCERDSDCLDQRDEGAGKTCERGYCVQQIGDTGCSSNGDCPPGHLCRPDDDGGACVFDPQAADRAFIDVPPPVCGDGVCDAPIETCMENGCPEDCGSGNPDSGRGSCEFGDTCELNLDCEEGGCLMGACQLLPDGAACTDGAMCENDGCGLISRECSSSCTFDSECGSDVCHLFQCSAPLDPGQVCDKASDCASGLCTGVCLADELEPGSVCLLDGQCASDDCAAGFCRGTCGDGFCTAIPNAEGCISCAADCGLCPDGNFGCLVDSQCQSGDCRGGFCGGVTNGEFCIANNQCASGVCNNAACAEEGSIDLGGICTTDDACDSGTCTAGFCVCDSDSDCPGSRECIAAVCVAIPTCTGNGGTCAFNSTCCSGRCDGVPPTCRSKLSNGSSCNENSDCRSGDCGDCNFLGTSCECT